MGRATRLVAGKLLLAGAAWASEPAPGGGEVSLFAGDLGNAIWTLGIFVLVVAVLGKYAWGPLLEALQRREQFIRDALTAAKHDRDAAEARLKEYEERLTQARQEASAIVEEGRRDAEALGLRLEGEARAESDRLIERAKREIELARDTAVRELYERSATMAAEIAGRVLRREVRATDHERLIAEAIDEIANREIH